MKKNTVEIFWTGGFDSTFRVVELSRLPIIIKPYYLKMDRSSSNEEINAIDNILKLLIKNSNTKAKFEKLSIIQKEDLEEDSDIANSYKNILKDNFIGTQYPKLAIFAKNHQGIELSIHKDDRAIFLINKEGSLKKINDKVLGDYYVLDLNKTKNEDVENIFKNFRLPIPNITKVEMKKYFLDNGYKDIMNLTWFCHSPKNGLPCGICNPCIYTINEGMKERLPKSALRRYHIRFIYRSYYKVRDVLKRKLLKKK